MRAPLSDTSQQSVEVSSLSLSCVCEEATGANDYPSLKFDSQVYRNLVDAVLIIKLR